MIFFYISDLAKRFISHFNELRNANWMFYLICIALNSCIEHRRMTVIQLYEARKCLSVDSFGKGNLIKTTDQIGSGVEWTNGLWEITLG